MSDDAQTPLLRHALRLAVIEADAAELNYKYEEARKAATPDFAHARNRGITQQKVVLPDGSEVGLISIYKGGTDVQVDEDELLLHVALTEPGEIEEYVLGDALRDKRVLDLLNEHLPELVGRRINAARRAQLQTELEENQGHVLDLSSGEEVKVATITPRPASGKFRYKPTDQAAKLIRAALDAGTLTRDGEIVKPDAPAQDIPARAGQDDPKPAGQRRTAGTVSKAAGKPGVTPTGEQQAVIDGFGAGLSLVVEAGAGSGKTSTLAMAAAVAPGRQGIYVAFNRSIADDARRSFPSTVLCSTAHALAMRAVGHRYQHRLGGPRIPAREQAQILRINNPAKVSEKILPPMRLARLAMETVGRFCKSADPQIGLWHVPRTPGLEAPDVHGALAAVILPYAQRAWADLSSLDGRLKFDHDHYLKAWQLSQPVLPTDFILFDEAQDASAVVLDVITRQETAQLIAAGDRAQAINQWNGAIDAMDKFPAAKRLTLSQSFRFGPPVAAEANKWLTLLGTDLRIRGFGKIPSTVGPVEAPDAVLCRTNAEAMAQAMVAIEAGRKAAIVGGGKEIKALAEAALDLKAGRGTSHPELFAFTSWGEVQDHVENDPTGADLRVAVDLIEKHGAEKIIAMVAELTDETQADVVVSTAHKAKGREWKSVRIAPDFREPRHDEDEVPEIPDDLMMLAYVAVTRGREALDRGGLAWVDKHIPAGAA
jgi:hypothetical protein